MLSCEQIMMREQRAAGGEGEGGGEAAGEQQKTRTPHRDVGQKQRCQYISNKYINVLKAYLISFRIHLEISLCYWLKSLKPKVEAFKPFASAAQDAISSFQAWGFYTQDQETLQSCF